MTNVQQNLEQIKQRMQNASDRSNRKVKDVTLIAVTKEVSVDRTNEVMDNGVLHLGENRPEGLQKKLDAISNISNDVRWHYIGTLQTRKVKSVINNINFLHSLDRMSLADEIEKRATSTKDCFVQVNVSQEESKHGLPFAEVEAFIDQLKNHERIRIIGLMTMAPNTEDDSIIRDVFQRLKQLQIKIAAKKIANTPCTELSMGMSGDYEIAIEEGATFIRIGTALVGKEREGIV
ncbi:YggS family pyridoxal phosphate-dependent enzyme [Psychrobacillus antarcticus]|uniref:YggS family pyridoxal phosphate-dependent enzyme n=1 Tax=Psychrobacillus antarcticus TaxID=2879115 RepID=UPI002407DF80|nr:YggS family pyridoxal phosphate-dependent enzyme [Psychrobacillus antarcticus]